MKTEDPYKILQVTRKSTPLEIVTSFKKLRYKYHPDRPKGSRDLYDKIIKAYENITKYPSEYVNVNAFIQAYKGSDEEHKDIVKAYEKYKGNMRYIMDSLILIEEKDEGEIRAILTKEIKDGNIKKYKIFSKKFKKRKCENKRAEKIAKKMGIDLSLSLEELINRQDNKQEDLIKRLEDKYRDCKKLEK